LSKEDFPVED